MAFQFFDYLGTVTHLFYRGTNIGAHGEFQERVGVVPYAFLQQRLDRRSHEVDDRSQVAGTSRRPPPTQSMLA